ncbi:ATP-binding protein [Streptomyces polychromogenes]|nr:ATP-binding protein [Streptomyces polychromogenes]
MDPPPSSPAILHRERAFDAEAAAACGAGIAWVRQTLDDWHLSDLGGDVVLAAAELLSNAAEHAGGIRRLSLVHHCSLMHIAVTDPSPDPPRLGEHRPGAVGGHGLFIIDRLSFNWGTRSEGSGKTVWADLPFPP